jgi:flagellar hook-length control protein FliK
VVDQVVRDIRVEVGRGRSEMTIRLDPPELGQIAVRLVSQNGSVTAGFHAESEGVRSLLESHLPALKSALADAGIAVQSFSVSTGTESGAFQQRSMDQPPTQRRRDTTRRATPAATQAVEVGRGRRSASSVDYFA